MWWDSGSADKWHYWYVHAKKQQKSSNKLGSQLMKVVEAMRDINAIRDEHVHHHSTLARWHHALAGLQSSEEADEHMKFAAFHESRAASFDHLHEDADAERQLDIYEHMLRYPKHHNLLDDVHWPLHCGECQRSALHPSAFQPALSNHKYISRVLPRHMLMF
jgi:hypothetical protein